MILELKRKVTNFSALLLLTFLLYPIVSYSINHYKNVDFSKQKGVVNPIVKVSDVITGTIINTDTNEIIPFCNLIVKENNYITSSNEFGEFSITLDSYPSTIVISHLSYETKEIIVVNKNSLIVKLKSYENQLNEVVLTNSNTKKAISIVNKTINKYESSKNKPLYGKSLYRQKSKNDDLFSEFAEIIYDVKFDNDGIIEWNIFEGRYALKKETINNKNFTLLSKILRVHQPNSDDLIFPLIREFSKYYNIKIINSYSTLKGELVTISFTPLTSIKTPIIEATVVINTETFDVIKVEGSIKNDDIKIVSLRDKAAVKKNYNLNFEISYRPDDVFGLVLDYINLNHEFDYYKENKLMTHLNASSNLTFFEYYNENPKTKKRKRYKYKSSDWDKLDIIGYNKSFWDNNPIVKRTTIDNKVIESFEELKAFESIFINANQQISINGSDISNDPIIVEISKKISKHYTDNLTQKVFLHTNKNKYSKGNKIYYSAFVTSEKSDLTFNKNDVLYVDLISNGSIVDSNVIKINHGKGNGSFLTNNAHSSGIYQIVGYTNYMKNFNPNKFFIKDIEILNPFETIADSENDKITVNFYPEGGHIVNDITNKIAYKAQDANGNFKTIQGKITDSDGNFISNIKSKHEGLGFFYLKPKKGKDYKVTLVNGNNYTIPNGINTGYSIIVDNINSRTMTVNIRSSDNLKSDKIYVLGLLNNKKYYQGNFSFEGREIINFEIPKNKLPSGVMHLVLLNESKKVIGNRSVYINNNDNLKIEAEIDKNYIDKEYVSLKIKNTNHLKTSSNISLSIVQVNNKQINSNGNLISHFKLPSYPQDDSMTRFINKTDRASNYKLDLMMLISNLNGFKWLEENSNDKEKKYKNENSIAITGIAKDKKGNLLMDTKVKLLTKSKERIWNYETITDVNGVFSINNFEEVDSTNLEFRTYNSKDKQIFSKIILDEEDSSNYLEKNIFPKNRIKTPSNVKNKINSNLAFSDNGELLEDVLLQSDIKQPKPRESNLNTTPDAIIEGESINDGTNIFRALSNIVGVTYVSDHYIDGGESISIRNSDKPPLWILDGVEITGPEAVNVKDIERVEVLKSLSKTAVYGPEGANGVVVFYSKKGVDIKNNNIIKTSKFTKLGYSLPEKFTLDNKNDNTLFWNPHISIKGNDYIEVLFKKPSNTAKFLNVTIQAINKNGEIGYLNKILNLE